jgi:polyhydroxybutyrate depolymerase
MSRSVFSHPPLGTNLRIRKWILPVSILFLSMSLVTGCGRNTTSGSVPMENVPASNTTPGATGGESQETYSAGDHALTMMYAGIERSYVLHIPPNLDPSRNVALVLAFHGIGLDASEMMRISGLNAQSDASGFIVVYPEGTGSTRSWNGGHCCGTAARDNVDDVGFVRALIGELTASLPVDPKQVHATGFSNGAIFTYRLACELSDLIASFGPVSAAPVQDDMLACAPSRPVSILHFHGTADEANPYDGALTQAGFQFLSVDDIIRFWTDFNGCPVQPQTTVSGSIQHDVYSPCRSGSVVELYTIEGGMHAWPGGEEVNQKMGEPNMEISATALLWEFFLTHPLP